MFVIALDGPSASGKSTVADLLAKKYNLIHIDSGAMYRAYTLYCLKNNIDIKNEKECSKVANNIHINFGKNKEVFLNDVDVSKEIRSIEVSDAVSFVSSYKDVRLYLINEQRKLALKNPIIMDGRDIGTFVFPNANIKLYTVASSKTRAARRFKENQKKGIKCSYDEVLSNIEKRDYIDSHRSFDPSKQAEDAILIDTSNLSIEQVVNKCIEIIDKKLKENIWNY